MIALPARSPETARDTRARVGRFKESASSPSAVRSNGTPSSRRSRTPLGAVLGNQAGHDRIDDAGACGDRVGCVQEGQVLGRRCGCKAALRPCGGCSLSERGKRDHRARALAPASGARNSPARPPPTMRMSRLVVTCRSSDEFEAFAEFDGRLAVGLEQSVHFIAPRIDLSP